MKRSTRGFIFLCLLIMLTGTALAAEPVSRSRRTKDSISIQPADGVLFDAPADGSSCDHDFLVHTTGKPVNYQIDDYFCCYVTVAVHSKMCKICHASGYDLEYEMVPHEDDSGICKRCGRVPFTPAVAVPLS